MRIAPVALLLGLSSFAVAESRGAVLEFSGNSLPALDYAADKSTGLEEIYVLYNVSGVSASYTAESAGSNVKWYRFSNLGGGYAEEIAGIIIDGAVSTLSDLQGDMGYIVEEGDRRRCFWVVEYEPKRARLRGLSEAADQDCDVAYLEVDGVADAIHYYTVNGQQRTLSRQLRLTYDTLEFDEAAKQYRQVETQVEYEYLSNPLAVRPPALCATSYTLSGDRFLEAWKWGESVESASVAPHAVEVMTEAVQAQKDIDPEGPGSNTLRTDTDGLGGSAPATVDFYAWVTDGVIHHEWQMADDQDFEHINYRFNQQDLSYTFDEEGVYYIRYVGSNDDGSCEAYGDTYTVTIGASELLCPNAFSPNGDGVNDEWKVAYRSLVEFKCWIFNRYGTELFYFDNPELGWDGKYNGKTVPPGVYFYVIQAVGADGKKYKKSGDINIIKNKKQGGVGSDAGAVE